MCVHVCDTPSHPFSFCTTRADARSKVILFHYSSPVPQVQLCTFPNDSYFSANIDSHYDFKVLVAGFFLYYNFFFMFCFQVTEVKKGSVKLKKKFQTTFIRTNIYK